jgi:alpha-D-xyloside xylohydrolase
MKFTHGIWEDRRDTAIYNATEVAAVSSPKPDTLRALCATRHVAHRGDTLNRATITLVVSATAPDIVSCAATHFKGSLKASEPRLDLFPDGSQEFGDGEKPSVVLEAPENTSTLATGNLDVILDKNSSSFNLAFRSATTGKQLTSIGFQGLQYIVGAPSQSLPAPLEASTKIGDPYFRSGHSSNAKPYMVVSFDLQVGELIYGLGERFGPLTKNGQEIDLWNEDAGTCTLYSTLNHNLEGQL